MENYANDALHIHSASSEIEFDGMVSKNEWETSNHFPLTMYFPVYNQAPEENSEVYITYDNTYLWVGAVLHYNDISKLVSTSKKRDEESGNSDAFGIVIDSYDDNENALAFFTMPSGLKIDYSISNDGQMGGTNYTWNTYWDVKTTMNEDAWHVEMRIPFSSLRFQSENDITKMGLIINRRISHLNEIDTYPAIDTKYGMGANTRPSLGETIIFEKIKSRNPVYVSPYVLAGTTQDHQLNEEGTAYVQSIKPKYTGGLDVKYNLNSNLTIDFTVNTDFAQVEADNAQVNLTRYDLFFPEKRLFFQERSGIFSYDLGGPQNLFYSRNIGVARGEPVTIYGGVRMVGRAGKWDVGFLDMNTAEFDNTPAENFGVARLRRQVINENSYIGGIVTSRIGFDGSYNYAYGIDGIFKYADMDYLSIKLAQSQDIASETRLFSLDPTYLSIELERRAQEGFLYGLKYAYWGNSFRPKAGFVFINNIHELKGDVGYGWTPRAESPIFNYSISSDINMTKRMEDGKIERLGITSRLMVNLKNGLGVFIISGYNLDGVQRDFTLPGNIVVKAGDYSTWSLRTHFFTPRTKKIVARLGLDGGGFYDGQQLSSDLTLDFNVSSSMQMNLSYQMDYINFPNSNQQFTNNLARLKATYMMNTKISMSAFVQYNEVDNVLISNFRLRYNPKDGNDLYLVLNDTRYAQKDNMIPTPPVYINQTVLLKYTHTFQL